MRLPDWQPRLTAYVLSCWTRPIEPGAHDCMLFGAGGVEAVTGVDLAADWRGRYTTITGGLRILKKAGYADHVGFVDAHLTRIRRGLATAGDIAAVPGVDDTLAIGIVQGALVYALAPTTGLALVPIDAATAVWEVR